MSAASNAGGALYASGKLHYARLRAQVELDLISRGVLPPEAERIAYERVRRLLESAA
jgi:hypothetical protein